MVHYLLNEVSHFHLGPLLGHVSLHLGVGVIDDGQEHVLYRKKEKIYFCVSGGHTHNNMNKQINKQEA